jgi:F0F1-type ATP synthase assembly protein I
MRRSDNEVSALDHRISREINAGFGDGLNAAVELIATPAIFGYLGHLLDERLGTGALFLIVFALIVFGYEVWRLVTKYNSQIRAHEADQPWAADRRSDAA